MGYYVVVWLGRFRGGAGHHLNHWVTKAQCALEVVKL